MRKRKKKETDNERNGVIENKTGRDRRIERRHTRKEDRKMERK